MKNITATSKYTNASQPMSGPTDSGTLMKLAARLGVNPFRFLVSNTASPATKFILLLTTTSRDIGYELAETLRREEGNK